MWPFRRKKRTIRKDISNKRILRDDKFVQATSVHNAWVSRDLNTMLAVIDEPAHPLDRHFLLQNIVRETYKRRGEPEMRELCRRVAKQHLKEFPRLAKSLRQGLGMKDLPHVTTFEYFATVLTEDGQYDEAISVCKMALKYRLNDNTKSGYKGRIQRIQKAKKRSK